MPTRHTTHPGRNRAADRNRWVLRLRRISLAVPLAALVAAVGSAAIAARSDAGAAPTTSPTGPTSATSDGGASQSHRPGATAGNPTARTGHRDRSTTRPQPSPSMSPGTVDQSPVTHTGGS